MPTPPSSAAGSAVVALAQIPRLAALLRGARARSPASDAGEGSGAPAAKFACANRVGLLQADITTLRVDAIVNAANRSLLGGGGVDGAIHRAAGKELLEACRELDGCDTGDAKTTGAFKLPSKHIVHTVGPVYSKTKPEQSEAQLRSAYRRSLEEAAAVGARSVAFPSISTGVYGYPIEDATRVALRVVGEWLTAAEGSETELVVFCTFSKKDRDVYERLAPEYFDAVEAADEQAGDAAPEEQAAEEGGAAAQEAPAAPEKDEHDEGVTTRAQAKTVAERRSASPQQERAATRD